MAKQNRSQNKNRKKKDRAKGLDTNNLFETAEELTEKDRKEQQNNRENR
ncbi:MAG: hypothetical protein GX020_08450 [Firmicutes bacterium]|jgi:hypothetical protein|nr:hypothetical protein [Bacillota bacterium]